MPVGALLVLFFLVSACASLDHTSSYESLRTRSVQLRKKVAEQSRLLPDENASDMIKTLNQELQSIVREMVEISKADTIFFQKGSAAEKAIERARKRDYARRLNEEKKRQREEDFMYVQNLRKMELVDKTATELLSRARYHGLDDYEMVRVHDLIEQYRALEANYIFNGTDMHSAETQKRMIEKFIGDSQSVEVTNIQRQKEILDRSIQELAARGVSFMCRSEMKTLDEMLAVYRENGIQLIELSNSKASAELLQDITAAQKAAQSQKLVIEKYIGTTKQSSPCAKASSNRYYVPKMSSS